MCVQDSLVEINFVVRRKKHVNGISLDFGFTNDGIGNTFLHLFLFLLEYPLLCQ